MLSNYIGSRNNDLTEVQIRRINNVCEAANMIGNLIAVMANDSSVDARWLSVARTDLQKGFMELVRAIEQPEGF